MKYCKKCGVLYAGILECCPKCNEKLSAPPELPEREPTKKEVRRQWLAIIIGIPALILFCYLVGWTMQTMGAH